MAADNANSPLQNATCTLLDDLSHVHCIVDLFRTNDVADHTSTWDVLNLRLTSDGDLTGDMLMDLPPTRAVLINPYNGSVYKIKKCTIRRYMYSKAVGIHIHSMMR